MNRLLILGNGNSRLDYTDYINSFDGQVWGANKIFQETIINQKLNLIGTVHLDFAISALEFKKKNNLKYDIYFSEEIKEYNEIKYFKNYHGWSTGSELLYKGLQDKFDEIHLIGYDSLRGKDNDIYYDKVVIKNFIIQTQKILKEFNKENVKLDDCIVIIK